MADKIQERILAEVADLHSVPTGAYNIRANGETASRNTTANIDIITKQDKPGIDIKIKAGTKNESVHIPVVISEAGIDETVYNDFYVGDDCDVVIVAGCGIHNSGEAESAHDGVHKLIIGENSKVKYVEKHFAEGVGKRSMKPRMTVEIGAGSTLEMETVQLGGVSDSVRETTIDAGEGATVLITERIMTSEVETVDSRTTVNLNGRGSSARINSRSVARDDSVQIFYPAINGNADCFGHVQCDSIIMDRARVRSIPEICANDVDAKLIHEAAIGKIAGDQILKLMTLGLTSEEAEERILAGLLK